MRQYYKTKESNTGKHKECLGQQTDLLLAQILTTQLRLQSLPYLLARNGFQVRIRKDIIDYRCVSLLLFGRN